MRSANNSPLRLAVSTLVLAALAVSESAACPLGREVDLEQPVLVWQRQMPVAKRARVTLVAAVGDGATVVKTLARIKLRCGGGRGEATVRIQRGEAEVTTTGFEPIIGACVESTFEGQRFTRAADNTITRVTVAF